MELFFRAVFFIVLKNQRKSKEFPLRWVFAVNCFHTPSHSQAAKRDRETPEGSLSSGLFSAAVPWLVTFYGGEGF